jgi:Fe-S oxidoreductase
VSSPLVTALTVVAVVATVVAVVLFTRTLVGMVRTYRGGQPISRSDNPGQRTTTLLRESLLASRLKQQPVGAIVATAHWIVLVAFAVLFLTLVTAYGQLLNPDFALPLIGHFPPFEWLVEGLAWLMVLSILFLIAVRLANRPDTKGRDSRFFGSTMWQAYYVEITILAVGICVIALRAMEYALGTLQGESWASTINFPFTSWIGAGLSGMSVSSLETGIAIVAFIKIAVSLAWLITVAVQPTMGVAWHRFLAFFNVWFQRNADGKPALGPLQPIMVKGEPIDFEDIDNLDDDASLGVGAIGDFTWKALLDFNTCTECGRCQSQCPAWNTEKPLSPKLLTIALREQSKAAAPWLQTAPDARADVHEDVLGIAERQLIADGDGDPWAQTDGGVLSPDVLWSCTMCGACVQQCPVDIAHIDHIADMRRYQVLMASEFPSELNGLFKNIETKGNPWGMNASDRNAWIAEVEFPVRVFGMDGEDQIPADVEYLFWVGCAGAFEDRAKQTTKAVAELLHMAGVEFMVLGEGETCNGDPARRAGNEFLFQMQAMQNVEVLNEIKAKKIVVTCPHCLNTLGREYPQMGGHYEVVHHTELLSKLVDDGKLTSVKPVDRSVTYHDPCYLGRHNDVITPPRELISDAGGALTEMPRHGKQSFCCGAGGARMWMEEKIGTSINKTRADEAIATGAQTVAVACPFCSVMMSDAVAAKQQDGQAEGVEVKDVARLMLEAAKGS